MGYLNHGVTWIGQDGGFDDEGKPGVFQLPFDLLQFPGIEVAVAAANVASNTP